MLPDKAAELLQLDLRGKKLLQACYDDAHLLKAIEMVQGGFDPKDVAELHGLKWDDSLAPAPEMNDGLIQVWVCRTTRCKQKERVSTSSTQPTCPSCKQEMDWLMSVDSVEEISHMPRTAVAASVSDPLYRTDRTRDNAPLPRYERD